jgi:hypothetical protein
MLSLTSKDLKADLVHAAKTVGVEGAATAAGTILAYGFGRGARSAFAPIGVGAAGGFMAVKGTSRLIKYGGVGIALGSLWALFDRGAEQRR